MTDISGLDALEAGTGAPGERRGGSLPGKIFGVAFDPATWGAVVYMLLALPLGIAYFVFTTVGLSLSLGLMVLIFGVIIALLFVFMTRGLSTVEGMITGTLLGADLTVEGSETSSSAQPGLWAQIKHMLGDARTWTSMIYMLLMLPLGIGYFTLAVTGFVTGLSMALAPLAALLGENIHIMMVGDTGSEFLLALSDFANSPAGMALVSLTGFAVLILMLHVSRAIGWFHARLAEKMLVRREG